VLAVTPLVGLDLALNVSAAAWRPEQTIRAVTIAPRTQVARNDVDRCERLATVVDAIVGEVVRIVGFGETWLPPPGLGKAFGALILADDGLPGSPSNPWQARGRACVVIEALAINAARFPGFIDRAQVQGGVRMELHRRGIDVLTMSAATARAIVLYSGRVKKRDVQTRALAVGLNVVGLSADELDALIVLRAAELALFHREKLVPEVREIAARWVRQVIGVRQAAPSRRSA
jgi:hypothetical protein